MSADHGGLDLNTVVNYQIKVNYVNTLLYSFSVINFPIPVHDLLFILIGDLTLEITLSLFTLLSASKPHFKKRPVIGNMIKRQ